MDRNNDNIKAASITIFLALTLTLIISVIFSAVESSRRLAVSSYLTGITELAMDSFFSQYCTQLWDEYQVFATVSNETEFIEDLEDYIETNLSINSFLKSTLSDIEICEYSDLTSDYGEAFLSQMLSYMQYKEISNVADYLLQDSSVDYDPTELIDIADGEMSPEALMDVDFGEMAVLAAEANGELHDEDFETDVSLTEAFSLDALATLAYIFDNTLIHYIVESKYDISMRSVDLEPLPTSYIEIPDSVFENSTFNIVDTFLLCEYSQTHFSSYTVPIKDSALDYQLEYLLSGMESDDENLIETAKQLVILRFGFNAMHILSDKEKFNTITSSTEFAKSIIPGLAETLQVLIICLWALSESIIDVRDLLAGKGVVLFKTAADWSLSMENMIKFDYNTESANKEGNGLNYNQYLEILLFKQDVHITALRILDLIQLDFSTNINDTFVISNCIIGAYCDIDYASNDIFSSVNFYHTTYFKPRYSIEHTYYYQ